MTETHPIAASENPEGNPPNPTTASETPPPTSAIGRDNQVDGTFVEVSDEEPDTGFARTAPRRQGSIARILDFPSSETNNSGHETFATPGIQSRSIPASGLGEISGGRVQNQPLQTHPVAQDARIQTTRTASDQFVLVPQPTTATNQIPNAETTPSTTRTLRQQEEWLTEQVLHQQQVNKTLIDQLTAISGELQRIRAQAHNRTMEPIRQHSEPTNREGDSPRVTFENTLNNDHTGSRHHRSRNLSESPERGYPRGYDLRESLDREFHRRQELTGSDPELGRNIRSAVSNPRTRREIIEPLDQYPLQDSHHSIQNLRRELKEMRTMVHKATSSAPEIDQLLAETDRNPFTRKITSARVPLNDKLRLPTYDGTGDPSFFIRAFLVKVSRADFRMGEEDQGKCQLFLESLRGEAQAWFTSLPPDSINCFEELRQAFFHQYMWNMDHPVSASDLYAVKQSPKETLRDFVKRFKAIYSRLRISDDLAIGALSSAIWYQSRFWDELTTQKPRTMNEAFHRANIHIKAEEDRAELAKTHGGTKSSRDTKTEERSEPRRHEKDLPKRERSKAETALAVLSNTQKGKNTYTRDPNAPTVPWCDYHKKPCHKTEDCRELKEKLLANYQEEQTKMKNQKATGSTEQELPDAKNKTEDEEVLPPPPSSQRRRINMIMGGLVNCDDSVRSIQQSVFKLSVDQVPRTATFQADLTFTAKDLKGVDFPHNDPLVIELQIGDCDVQRILVDTGSSVDVISLDTLQKMQVKDQKIKARVKHLTAFGGDTVSTIGTIKLPVSTGGVTKIVKFEVVEKATIYNAIVGTPWLFSMEAVPSTYHQCLKFPTAKGFFTIRGDQRMARRCFITENKLRRATQTNTTHAVARPNFDQPTSAMILSELLEKGFHSEPKSRKKQPRLV